MDVCIPRESSNVATLSFLLVLSLLLESPTLLCSASRTSLTNHSSLSVENAENDTLVSPNGIFSAGFYPVGYNAYCFAIWFNIPRCKNNCTVVWMANRDEPVNGRYSKFSLKKSGNLVLTDAGEFTVWSSNSFTTSSVQLQLLDNGNLVLHDMEDSKTVVWQSFDSPTNTLLPQQSFTKGMRLVSSRSRSNVSSGFYKLLFHQDNILFLVFDGPETSSVYWPYPWLLDNQLDRSRNNGTRIAFYDNQGHFLSSDQLKFRSTDSGAEIPRRLTLDFDGNLRLYSLEDRGGSPSWTVTWQAISKPCRIHGTCGPNSLCIYDPDFGRKCTCPPRFKMKNKTDWSYGCEPEFYLACNQNEVSFVKLHHIDFYGYNIHILRNYTFEKCRKTCLEMCNCKGFLYKFMVDDGFHSCYPKRELRNGHRSADFNGTLFLKFPKSELHAYAESLQEFQLNCSDLSAKILHRNYQRRSGNGSLKVLLWCSIVLGWIELIGIFMVLFFLYGTCGRSAGGYHVLAVGFRRFTFDELKRATRNFSHEVGRGGAGVLYKGVLPDQRTAAVKRLNDANQGEELFLAEVSTIGRLNHMNLIDIWGYCVEGKHRLLVYEYLENGSLADKLLSNSLDWDKRFNIAVGTAKGLAYLHEECLEWVLHCDVKPQNIMLDSNYEPKVADFGLSKILNRAGIDNVEFSKIRGTRGYMAPEWVFSLPITAKVDVYSYGMVVLEMVTGKSQAMGVDEVSSSAEIGYQRLVTWVREKKHQAPTMEAWVETIINPLVVSEYDTNKLGTLAQVALQCVEEDKDARPTMSQVIEMLLAADLQAMA